MKEHEPTTGLDAAKLAQQYISTHRGSQHSHPKKGNFKSFPSGSDEPHVDSNGAHAQKVAPEKKLVCYYCQQPGHKATVCPVRKSKLTGFCYVPREEDIDVNNTRKTLCSSDCKWTMFECFCWTLVAHYHCSKEVTCRMFHLLIWSMYNVFIGM